MKHRFLYFILAVIFFIIAFSIKALLTKRSWDGSRRITMVVNSQPMIIFSLEPATKRAVLFSFPINTLLKVPYGYGLYPASSIFRLGTLDDKHGGGKLLTKSIENTFAVAVNGYFAAKSDPFLLSIPDFSQLQDFKWSYFSLLGAFFSSSKMLAAYQGVETNFSLIDMLYLWKAIRNIRTDRIKVLPLEQSKVLKDEVLPDGSKVKIIKKDLLDFVISDNFQDQLVRSEDISIEVVNASGKEKVASEFSQILTHMGARVVSKSTAEENKAYSCKVFVSQKSLLGSHIISRVKRMYGCKLTSEAENITQADVKIVLGEEFTK